LFDENRSPTSFRKSALLPVVVSVIRITRGWHILVR
jgi:hypothetical protein